MTVGLDDDAVIVGVHDPSSYQFSNWLVLPAAELFAVKLMPLAAVPWVMFPVLKLTSPINVGVVMEGDVENTRFVLVVPVAPLAV